MLENYRILQIIPATGHYAVFKDKGLGDITTPLACFALVEDLDCINKNSNEPDRFVVGMIAHGSGGAVEFCDDIHNFSDYTTEPIE